MRRELIIDSFAGGGGASLGIQWALGRGPDIAINHDESALKMHAANHPDTKHVLEDVWKADLKKLVGKNKVGLLWCSPDCFIAGTLVLTDIGLVPIETIRPGQMVLTHQGRWRPVISTMSKDAATVSVRGHGHYGIVTTPEHKFYSKRVVKRYPNNKKENGKRVGTVRLLMENPYWPKAEELKGKLWATPRKFDPVPIPACHGIEFSESFFYWLGRWVGDGSLNKGDAEICCGNSEFESVDGIFKSNPFRNAIGQVVEPRIVDRETTFAFVWGNADLVRWLKEHFGEYCHTKSLPTWCLTMQANWRRALMKGYCDADGSTTVREETNSVSKSLSISVRLLAVSLGFAASLYEHKGGPAQIEGRHFIAKDQYRVAWREHLQTETVMWDKKHLFSPVREITDTGKVETVYCLEVQEDESYVADGIVVHNCKHFSSAKGGKPVEKGIRSLAWIVCKWASTVRPRVICLENVREFADWGPLTPVLQCRDCDWKGTEGQATLIRVRRRCPRCESLRLKQTEDMRPDPKRKGHTFRRFVRKLKNCGYKVEWRNLNASEYGVPTNRRRLFLVARCDGESIVWPEPSHGKGRITPLSAASCIDWSIPCPSIFDRPKPLVEKTMHRLAMGIKRFVLENPNPFIVGTSHTGTTGRGSYNWPIDDPLRTVSRSGEFAVVTPIVSKYHHSKTDKDDRCQQLELPFSTLDTQPRFAIVAPVLARQFGTSKGGMDIENPMPTVMPDGAGGKIQLMAATLERQFGNSLGADILSPAPTVMSNGAGKTALVAALLATVGHGHFPNGSDRCKDLNDPTNTITSKNDKAVASVFLAKHFGGVIGVPADHPMPTQTMRGTQTQVVAANMIHLNHGEKTWNGVDEPLRTVTTGNHAFLVYSFLTKYFGNAIGANLLEPCHTVTGKDRFGLVTVTINGETWVIVDIGMRMLTPRELARAQGFPDTYILTGGKTSQTAKIGNSVCPLMAKTIVAANYSHCMIGV